MNISKELLEEFNITSINIKDETKSINCFLVKSDFKELHTVKKFYFKYFQKFNNKTELNNFFSKKHHKLYISVKNKENDTFFISESTISIVEYGLDFFTVHFITYDSFLATFINKISFLEYQDQKYGRRKEPRISINKENFSTFGLSSLEQKIFSKSAKIIQPCAIIDISLHGICIITSYTTSIFKNIENFHINISFENPKQNVILQAHKVHTKLTETNSKIFSTISCQLLEPIPYIWKERVINMFEQHYNE